MVTLRLDVSHDIHLVHVIGMLASVHCFTITFTYLYCGVHKHTLIAYKSMLMTGIRFDFFVTYVDQTLGTTQCHLLR